MRFINFLKSDYRLRIFCYFSIWLCYLSFMSQASLRGIDWLPFQEERVRNAIAHMLDNPALLKYGLTSWLPLDFSEKEIYAVQAHEYIHYYALMKIGGEQLFSKVAPHVDKLIIFLLSFSVAEISLKLFEKYKNLSSNIIGVSSFIIFSTSPYTYRMLLASWQDTYFLLFLFISYLLFYSSKYRIGLAVLTYGLLWQYHWSALLGFLYLLIYIYVFIFNKNKNLILIFPPGFRSKIKSKIFIIVFFFAPLINLIQNIFLRINGYQLSNSSFLFRVGINNALNWHHGGWISALQFIGGNRISFCLQPASFNVDLADINFVQIFTYNCIFSIISFSTISIIAIISYSLFARKEVYSRWILVPLFITFIVFISIFQQALAAHLQGHSIFFAPIFSIGIISIFFQFSWLKKNHLYSHILFFTIVFGVVITNIRVSFLTGVNG